MLELSIRGLSKTYPNGVRALSDATLTIPTGMFGLLGPNGAGKSTLMRTLATLQEADSGSARIGESDLDLLVQKDEVRRILGYLPQEFGVYPKISAETMLTHFAVLNEKEVPLDDWIDLGVLSSGSSKNDDKVLVLEKQHLTARQTSFDFVVSRKPSKGGIDPLNKLIDRNPEDNTKKVGAN